MVALAQRLHTGADIDHDPCAFVAKNGREQSLRIVSRQSVGIGVADARCLELDQHLARARSFKLNRFNAEWCSGFERYSGAHFHL